MYSINKEFVKLRDSFGLDDCLWRIYSFDHSNPPFPDPYSNIITGPILGGQVIIDLPLLIVPLVKLESME